MYDHNPTILSAVDYARLQGLMCTLIGSPTPLAALLRRKLESVAIVRPCDAGPDVVTAERTVRFRINDRDREERKLVWLAGGKHADPSLLSLREARGLALLGLTVGQSIAYGIGNGHSEILTVERVLTDEDRPVPVVTQEGAALLARL
jgi:regulator of nucleoside diphosphate kinase